MKDRKTETLNLEQLWLQLPFSFKQLYIFFQERGHSLTFVGGFTRQLFTSVIKKEKKEMNLSVQDWDLEWRKPTLNSLNIPNIPIRPHDLALWIDGEVEELSFGVWRMHLKNSPITLELTPARIEIFDNTSSHHKNFTPIFTGPLTFEQSFKRRDFTVNAIGLDFEKQGSTFQPLIHDPLQGLKDLAQGLLRPCGPDFYLDPVRFLRAIRFSITLQMEVTPELKSQMERCDLSGLTLFYFYHEAFKSGDFWEFFKHYFELAKNRPPPKWWPTPIGLLFVEAYNYGQSVAKFNDNFKVNSIDHLIISLLPVLKTKSPAEIKELAPHLNIKEKDLKWLLQLAIDNSKVKSTNLSERQIVLKKIFEF